MPALHTKPQQTNHFTMIARLTTTNATSMKLMKLLLITIASIFGCPNIAIAITTSDYGQISANKIVTTAEDDLEQEGGIWILGSLANGAGWNTGPGTGLAMTKEGSAFVAKSVEFEANDEIDPLCYFHLTDYVGETWDDVVFNANRYGASYEKEPIAIGEAVTVTPYLKHIDGAACSSWAIAPGKYDFTFDIPSMTLLVERVVPKKLSTPEIRFDAGKVEITCVDTEGKIYYTLDGSTPTTESTRYIGTFGIDRNYPIRAIAVAEGKLDSDIAEYTPSYFRCEPPTYTYDGHYLTLHKPLEDAKISFYIENSNYYGDPQYYNGIEIDMVESYTWMRQYNKLYAHVEAPYMNNSETLTFDPPYYCWKETYGRYTTTIVDLRQGLEGKMSDILKSDDISRIESLYVMGDINTSDLATMRNMPLIWLYLEGATFLDEHLPDNAFSIETLRCVTVPHNFKTAGRELFKNATELCSVRWVNRPDEPILTLDMLGVQHNPNLVIRTNYPDPSLNEIKNIIDLGDKSQANIVLTDGYPFEIAVSPNTYVIDVVGSITYKRSFTQRSGYGENAAGWETLMLPFDVDEITYNGMVITPFDGTVNDAEGHHFWLYMFDGNGWTRATEIKKGLPYIMSVPNNAVYDERWNIPGEYTFTASNNWLSTRAEYSYFGSRIPDFSYFGQPASSDVYALNTYDASTSNAPGSVFLPGHKDVRPFEWYFTDENSPSRISIFGDFSGLENVYADMTDATGLEVSAKGGVLRITSDRDRTVRIVNMTVTVIKTVDVRAGQPATVDDLTHGFYIVENIKVVL